MLIKRLITKSYIITVVGCVLAFSSVPVVQAEGWYVTGSAGGTDFRDTEVTDTPLNSTSIIGTAKGEAGYIISAAIGRPFGAFRLEGEVSYQRNHMDKGNLVPGQTLVLGVTVKNNQSFDISGQVSALSVMANAWYDWDMDSSWTPYVGGGVGMSKIDLDIKTVYETSVSYNESDYVLAYQLGAGLNYELAPDTSVLMSYRFYDTSDSTDPTFDNGSDKIELNYSSHSLMIGLAYWF